MMEVQSIDVGDGCKRIEREQEDLPNGHCVKDHYIKSVIPSSRREAFYFDRTFDFTCRKMPTSWNFRITFTRSQDQEVSCVTTVKRTDQAQGSVDVQLCTTVGKLSSDDACANHTFDGMTQGQRGNDSAKDIISWFDADKSAGKELPVEFFLTVNGCHNEQDMLGGCAGSVETMETDDSKDSSARKREETMDTGDSEDSSPRKRLRVQSSS